MARRFVNRRSFLKSSTLVAGAAALPHWSLRKALAAESPAARLRVGCIGVGGRGTYIGNLAAKLGDRLACADVDSNHAKWFVGDAKCDIYGDYREILDRKDIDVVTIATPDHWHSKILIDAVKAGKDVYCEKPMTLTIDEGKKICEVVKNSDRVVQVGTQQRSSGQFLLAVALAQSGRLGKTLKATCFIGGGPTGGPFEPKPVPPELNWDAWLGQCPVVDYCPERCHGAFRGWLEYAGGILTDWGAHHVDIGQWAIGGAETGPVEIEGTGEYPVIPEGFDMAAFFAGRAKLPNSFNTVLTFEVTHRFANGSSLVIVPGPGNGVMIEGELGRIFVNRGRLSGKPVEDLTEAERKTLGEQAAALYRGKSIDPFDVATDDAYDGYERASENHMANFLDCVKDRGTPVSDVFTHHRAVSTCHLSNIAMLMRRKLRWDPDKQDFVGDEQASALLSRPQRPQYAITV